MYKTFLARSTTSRPGNKIAQGVWFLATILELILVTRFTLILIEIDPTKSFPKLIYSISDPLVKPFHSIVSTQQIAGMTVEWTTLIAILAYWILMQVIVYILTFSVDNHDDEIPTPIRVEDVIIERKVS